jgi:hypothetical protein
MTTTAVLIAYAPLALAAVLPVLLLWDSSIRRDATRAWPAVVQGVLGVLMLLCAGATVAATVAVLASYDGDTTDRAASALLALATAEALLAVLCLATLVAGFAWPGRPTPRRGFTGVVLAADLVVVGVGLWYVNAMLPMRLETVGT